LSDSRALSADKLVTIVSVLFCRHGFAVSMFERLVEHNKLPFQFLSRQCRMRDEFVPMLLPIYPFLKSHTALVSGSRNIAPTCMEMTMYFWSHTFQETSQRSYANPAEADMVIALARWIVSELEDPRRLSILAAYGRQVRVYSFRGSTQIFVHPVTIAKPV